ncbi:mitogen-activated protein kinase kinase kinase [Trypanosoma brucei equiperdum]|uniref:Mitogen-activated protein kinase kinase kinase n=1 Tax=Trypanosoma brucei equiperdum TaxID=630700 RepID=A0A3L6KWV7_9TRYP|nr:mitogen-activated protein kinase kinase kinase [Trypanosoma brucei equiperdum]
MPAGMCSVDVAELNQITMGKKLGSGSFGSVYAGILPSGQFVAVKELELAEDSPTDTEVEVHKKLVHENVIRYLHSRIDNESTPKRLYLYLEFVTGGSVSSLMKTLPNGHLPYPVVRVYSRQMFSGLEYLHRNKVAHRDIKGDNLLISMDTGIAKLADFDQAKVMTTYGTLRQAATSTLAGTPYWMAPEVITDENGYDPFKADIWSAGCTVAEMITGRAPWTPMANVMHIMNKLAMSTGWPDAIPKDPNALGSQEAYDFLDLCFRRTVAERPDAATLLQHPFLKV